MCYSTTDLEGRRKQKIQLYVELGIQLLLLSVCAVISLKNVYTRNNPPEEEKTAFFRSKVNSITKLSFLEIKMCVQ